VGYYPFTNTARTREVFPVAEFYSCWRILCITSLYPAQRVGIVHYAENFSCAYSGLYCLCWQQVLSTFGWQHILKVVICIVFGWPPTCTHTQWPHWAGPFVCMSSYRYFATCLRCRVHCHVLVQCDPSMAMLFVKNANTRRNQNKHDSTYDTTPS